MKNLFIISLLLLVGGYGFGQDTNNYINGIWVQCNNGYSSKILELKQNGKFNHYFSSCVGQSSSKGTYKIIENTLVLGFKKSDVIRTYIINEDSSLTSSDERPLTITTNTTFKTAFKDCGNIFDY